MTAPAVEFDSVSIVFGNNPAAALPLMDDNETRESIKEKTGQILGVHDCSLQVQQGEVVVFMGLSGSGKSTLLRAVNGLNKISRGRICVHDGKQLVDLTAPDAATLRAIRTTRVSMVFQQFGLLPWRTVEQNVAFGLEIADVPAAARAQKVTQQLAMVNLDGWGHCKVSELSGGMQQRVGLARAFATESPILLMDEPFSALDPLIRVRLQDELLDLQQQLQRTILFVSHDLDEALKLGNRIVIMEGGRVVQIGTPQEIIQTPATQYVADFVAHMNPLKTLRAESVMRQLSDANESEQATAKASDAMTLTTDTPLAEVLRAKTQTPAPILITQNGTPVGIIDHQDIYKALL